MDTLYYHGDEFNERSLLWQMALMIIIQCGINVVNVVQVKHRQNYRKFSNIRRILLGNEIVDHSDVVGASPVVAAPTTSSFSTWHLASRDSPKDSPKTVRIF